MMTLSGAYGRDYKSKAKILEDWNLDRDFVIRTLGHNAYINRQDAEKEGLTKFGIRYQKDTKIAIISKKGDSWKA